MTNKRIPQPPSPIGYGEPREQTKITEDRKSTRLNSSHSQISYAVFCLKKKNNSMCSSLILEYAVTLCSLVVSSRSHSFSGPHIHANRDCSTLHELSPPGICRLLPCARS